MRVGFLYERGDDRRFEGIGSVFQERIVNSIGKFEGWEGN